MRVCLIGATHVCHNPRLLREADTLADAGCEVRVVTPSWVPELAEKDQRSLARRRWRLETVDFLPTRAPLRSRLLLGRKRLAAELSRWIPSLPVYEYGYVPVYPELLRLACREPADWVIGHTQAALPVAAAAALRLGARLGFDCEDLVAHNGSDPTKIVEAIEARYLRRCDYVTVPSQAIAEYLAEMHHIARPEVLYNVFPQKLAAGMTHPSERPLKEEDEPLRLHWFSQTLGPDRGLEDALDALGLLRPDTELHLRGHVSEAYRDRLLAHAGRVGAAERVRFHPPVDHDDLIRTMDGYHLGLALEPPNNINKDRTSSNKLFSYILAGLPVAASDTMGQREVLDEIPECGFLYPSGDAAALAAGIRRLAESGSTLRAAGTAAWDAARSRYCWDVASRTFLRLLEQPRRAEAGS